MDSITPDEGTSPKVGTGFFSSKKKEVAANDKDRDASSQAARTRVVGAKCGNPECYARQSEVTLKACSRCKSMRYCSRECQAAHWKSHKDWCNNNIGHVEELARADAMGFKRGLPPGVTLLELDQKLEKWVKFHTTLLLAATIHALSLPRDIKRSRLYLLRVQVSYRSEHGGITAKFFRVDDAFLIDIDTAHQIDKMREESESQRRGAVAAVALECNPLAMQIVPFGSLRDLSPLRIQQRWKEILIRDVENGKRATRFDMKD
ncbi:hypothetical protein BDZ97DRAFT_1852863 [Flammula alnicola]|nr:hypothetical protein BDZ97DRAFT_1852863 [Flammula alnicola]